MPENLFTKQMELIELYIEANKVQIEYYISLCRLKRQIIVYLTSTPHTLHQRPPSVGMPRHAFRRRIPNSTHTTPPSAVAARCGGGNPIPYLGGFG